VLDWRLWARRQLPLPPSSSCCRDCGARDSTAFASWRAARTINSQVPLARDLLARRVASAPTAQTPSARPVLCLGPSPLPPPHWHWREPPRGGDASVTGSRRHAARLRPAASSCCPIGPRGAAPPAAPVVLCLPLHRELQATFLQLTSSSTTPPFTPDSKIPPVCAAPPAVFHNVFPTRTPDAAHPGAHRV